MPWRKRSFIALAEAGTARYARFTSRGSYVPDGTDLFAAGGCPSAPEWEAAVCGKAAFEKLELFNVP